MRHHLLIRHVVAGFALIVIPVVAAIILVIPGRNIILVFANKQDETMAQQAPSTNPPSGLVFATKIATNGQAIDPGTTFPSHVKNLYAVFRPDMAPPGMRVNVDNPTTGDYYAYLKVKEDSTVSSFGWRWYHKGRVVNEYGTEVQPGDEIWLQRYNYSEDGIFGGDDLGPGSYTIVILLGGNPAMSAELTIKS
jgi:hypothetical protein